MDEKLMKPEKSAASRAGLRAALDAGFALPDSGGSALDAVTMSFNTAGMYRGWKRGNSTEMRIGKD